MDIYYSNYTIHHTLHYTTHYTFISLLKTDITPYHATIGILWFINQHSGVTGEADFPVGNVWGDRQGQVERPPKPWADRGNRGHNVNQLQFIQLGEREKKPSVNIQHMQEKQKRDFWKIIM